MTNASASAPRDEAEQRLSTRPIQMISWRGRADLSLAVRAGESKCVGIVLAVAAFNTVVTVDSVLDSYFCVDLCLLRTRSLPGRHNEKGPIRIGDPGCAGLWERRPALTPLQVMRPCAPQAEAAGRYRIVRLQLAAVCGALIHAFDWKRLLRANMLLSTCVSTQ